MRDGDIYIKAIVDGRFGRMCPYKDILCQERSGCGNCAIYKNQDIKKQERLFYWITINRLGGDNELS